MASVIVHENNYDECLAASEFFDRWVDSLYDVTMIIGYYNKATYRIIHNKKFREVFEDSAPYQHDKRRDCRIVFEYNTRALEHEWIRYITDLLGVNVRGRGRVVINDYIGCNKIQLLKKRSELIDRYMPEMIDGFKDNKIKQYVLEHPSMRMLSAGECALTHPQLRACSED